MNETLRKENIKKSLERVKEKLEFIEFSTHMSCEVFNGKECDANTKQAYEEKLWSIRNNVRFILILLDDILSSYGRSS